MTKVKIGLILTSVAFLAAGCSSGGQQTNTTTKPATSQSSVTTNAAASSNSPAPTETSSSNSYTMEQLAAANSGSKCWTAVNGKVYDLTPFISKHPGGAANIMRLCGKDGTTAFLDQHGGQRRPEQELAGLEIGTLK